MPDYQPYATVLARSRARRGRRPERQIYGKHGLGFESELSLDRAILRALDDSQTNEGVLRATAERIERELPSYIASFKATFSDFRCDFPIYVVHSLDCLDGAGRIINGMPSLILGVDVIASEDPSKLGILLDHELFHRYRIGFYSTNFFNRSSV